MKPVDSDLKARFARSEISLCLCWRVRRTDQYIIGFTDHDQALKVDAVTYHPNAVLAASSFSQGNDLRPGRANCTGILSSDVITEEDLQAGLWNRAVIDVFRVDWLRPDLGGLPVWSGFFSDIECRGDGAFEAELISLKAELEQPFGRIVSRQCDAVLGDHRCGKTGIDGMVCDQRFETCRDVFDNAVNFRGFPDLPGPDFIIKGPTSGRRVGSG